MKTKPIDPTTHASIDYVLVVLQVVAPSFLGLKGRARALSYGFAATTGIINALSDHPLGLKRKIPFSVHGRLEAGLLPLLLALPWAAGAFESNRGRLFFGSFFVAALANYLLTDYNVYETGSHGDWSGEGII